jgi:hypothetical protein
MIAATVASFCIEDVGTRRLQKLTQSEISGRLAELSALVRA